jgi:hypothetical protein
MEQHIPQLDIRTTDLLNDLIAALRIQREIVEARKSELSSDCQNRAKISIKGRPRCRLRGRNWRSITVKGRLLKWIIKSL